VNYVRLPEHTDGPLGTPNDGIVVTRYEYDRKSRRTFLIEDDLSTLQTLYDGVDRVILQIDPEENEVRTTYDDNNNVVKVVEVEITPRDDVATGTVPDLRETFVTIHVYDSLNRLLRTTDNIGQTTRHHYDSRDNLIFTSDAQHSQDPADLIPDPLGLFPAPVNRPGNTMEYFYDGLNRKLAEVRHLRVGGQGKNPIDTSNAANPDGLIVIDYDWDANSRLVAMADDGSLRNDQNTSVGVIEASNPRGNVCRYVYDDLNRLAREIFDDQTCNVYTYDADDNLVRMIDENGSSLRNTYDGMNRLVRRDITRATSATPHPVGCVKDQSTAWQVVGTTVQEFEYDGLSRPTRSFDNNEPDDSGDDAIVLSAYDSLSRLLEEVQNGHAISSRWAGDNNRIGLVYPNGRELEVTFDKLDRIDLIRDQRPATSDQRPIVDYDYIGPGRVLERTHANGVRLTFLDDARQRDIGYDGLKRVLLHRHVDSARTTVAGFEYAYNRENHKLSERKLQATPREDYAYDSFYRLIQSARDGQVSDRFQLDGTNNWVARNGVMNQSNNMNEYASFGNALLAYDENGNLLDDGAHRYQYDFANRLKRILHKADNVALGVYAYDAHGRRLARTVSNSNELNDRVQYTYDRWHELEERRGAAVQQYVYSQALDDPLTLDRDENSVGRSETALFYHDDGRGHIVALTNESGRVVERMSYDAFGRPSFEGADGRPLGIRSSPSGNPFLFTGRRYDPEAGLYYYRARYYHPRLGRFQQRDPFWMEPMNLGNAYAYVGNNPISWLDPLGLAIRDQVRPPVRGGYDLAADLYQRLLSIVNPAGEGPPSLRWLAQLAVNIVDYLDPDDIYAPQFLETPRTFGIEFPVQSGAVVYTLAIGPELRDVAGGHTPPGGSQCPEQQPWSGQSPSPVFSPLGIGPFSQYFLRAGAPLPPDPEHRPPTLTNLWNRRWLEFLPTEGEFVEVSWYAPENAPFYVPPGVDHPFESILKDTAREMARSLLGPFK
jgi:RHS repeat-associated protein